ncbi:MAG: hypothetical protein HXX81_06990, partial [Campylobacterales bacterium]|nr:hypothetical protein [Campylobacterales bacterium]
MINVAKILRVSKSVLDFKFSGDVLKILDNGYNFYIASCETFKLVKAQNISSKFEQPHTYSKAFTLNNNSLFLIPLLGTQNGFVLAFNEELQKVTTISKHKKDIEVATFSHDGKMLATGGADGVLVISDTKTFNTIISFLPRADYISAITFSNNNNYIVYSSFDKTTIVFDLFLNRKLAQFLT